MLSLPLELRVLIAHNDSNAWFHMWRYDPDFRKYSETERERKLFVDLFTVVEKESDATRWKLFGKRHRENDYPAVTYDDEQFWYQNDLRHRENDRPAAIYFTGIQQWYKKGLLHRENGLPAIIHPDGTNYWFLHGERVNPDGTQYWLCAKSE